MYIYVYIYEQKSKMKPFQICLRFQFVGIFLEKNFSVCSRNLSVHCSGEETCG